MDIIFDDVFFTFENKKQSISLKVRIFVDNEKKIVIKFL